MMTTFKVACNDDEVVVMHSGLEGYIKSNCSSVACLFVCADAFKVSQKGKKNVCNVIIIIIYDDHL